MQRADGKHISAKRIALLVITVLVVAFIFVQSILPRRVSLGESEGFVDIILNPILTRLGLGPITSHLVRKIAHITEFTILSVLLLFCFRGRVVKSVCVGFLTAFLDESIQILSDRGPMISDVWIDLIGVAIGTLLGFLLRMLMRRRKKAGTER